MKTLLCGCLGLVIGSAYPALFLPFAIVLLLMDLEDKKQ